LFRSQQIASSRLFSLAPSRCSALRFEWLELLDAAKKWRNGGKCSSYIRETIGGFQKRIAVSKRN
jgi:hypothetical protein